MINEGRGEEFRNRVVVYVDARTVDVGVIVRIKVRFGGEDARDGDEGDDDDGMRDACSSPLEVMLTSCYGAEGRAKDWDVDETSQGVVSLETTQQQIVVEISIKIKRREVRRQGRDGWMTAHTVAG